MSEREVWKDNPILSPESIPGAPLGAESPPLSFAEMLKEAGALPPVLGGEYDPLQTPPDLAVVEELKQQAAQEAPYSPSYRNRLLAANLVGYSAAMAKVDLSANTHPAATLEEALASDFVVLTKIVQSDNAIALRDLVDYRGAPPPVFIALDSVLEALHLDKGDPDLAEITRDAKTLLRIRLLFQQWRGEELYTLRGFVKPKPEEEAKEA